MVTALFTFVSKWIDLFDRAWPLPAWFGFARGRALPWAAPLRHALPFHECGRGGTGRRATLRSLWAKARGSSSLLDRTSMETNAIRGIACFHAQLYEIAGLFVFRPCSQKVVSHDLWLTRRPSRPTCGSGLRDLCRLPDPDCAEAHDGLFGRNLDGAAD